MIKFYNYFKNLIMSGGWQQWISFCTTHVCRSITYKPSLVTIENTYIYIFFVYLILFFLKDLSLLANNLIWMLVEIHSGWQKWHKSNLLSPPQNQFIHNAERFCLVRSIIPQNAMLVWKSTRFDPILLLTQPANNNYFLNI